MSNDNINNNKYRLVLSSESESQRKWSFILTWNKVLTFAIIALLIYTAIVIALILYTPVQKILPNYELRREYITNTLRVDSLISEVTMRNRYIDNFKNVITSKEFNSVMSEEIDSAITTSSLIGISEREKDFIKRIDESEKFNLKVLTPLAAQGILFNSPVEVSVIAKTPTNYKFRDGIKINTPKNSAISTVYDGNIIDISYNIENGNSVTIQHPQGFISKYVGLGSIYVTKGVKVIASETIGSVNTTSGANEGKFTFELWHDGLPLDPQKYISF